MIKFNARSILRRLSRALIALGVTTLYLSCSDDPEFDFTAREGDRCEGCDDCRDDGLFSHCECETCIDTAYDPDNLLLLDCIDRKWVPRLDCPGGVSVKCDGNAYRTKCLGDNGENLLR